MVDENDWPVEHRWRMPELPAQPPHDNTDLITVDDLNRMLRLNLCVVPTHPVRRKDVKKLGKKLKSIARKLKKLEELIAMRRTASE